SYGSNTEYYISPKLDGLRAIYDPHFGFFTRQGLPWAAQMTEHIQIAPDCRFMLDGEFYCHGMSLQDINSAMSIGRSAPTELTRKIQFHVFDSPNAGQSFLDRWTRLSTTYGLFQANVTLVQQNLVRCWASLFNAFQAYVAGGYEGAMLRNPSAGYQSGRTTALLKWKTDQLVDAKVIGLNVGVGKFEGILGSIECALPSGTKFSVGSGWMDEERKH